MTKIFPFLLVLLSMIACNRPPSGPTEPEVLIMTNYGDITVKLYNETPIHRDNFLKLAGTGKYDSLIFHRVINTFMIQGGGLNEGKDDIGEDLPAEIVFPKYFHKKGALAAAREGDNINPDKKSSGSQFYIVQGKPFTDEMLKVYSQRTGVTYTPEQIEVYKTVGGTPHLDSAYTVFGEVIKGLEVVDKIAAAPTGRDDKPLKDIVMTMKVVKK